MDKFAESIINDLEEVNKRLRAKNRNLTKQVELMQYQKSQMAFKTLKIFKAMGISDKEIISYYEKN